MSISIGNVLNGAKFIAEGVGTLVSKIPAGAVKNAEKIAEDLIKPIGNTFKNTAISAIEKFLSEAGKKTGEFIGGKIMVGADWLSSKLSKLLTSEGMLKALNYVGLAQTVKSAVDAVTSKLQEVLDCSKAAAKP